MIISISRLEQVVRHHQLLHCIEKVCLVKGDRPAYLIFRLLFVHYFLITDEVLDCECVRKYLIQFMIIFQPGTHEIQAGNLASVTLASIRCKYTTVSSVYDVMNVLSSCIR